MAEGFVLSISPAMLKRLDEADGKISKLQTTSDKTSSKIMDDFRRMATGVDPFINKLKEAQSLLSKMSSPNISIKGFKETATDGEKAAKATASITESLNKIKSNPIDDINKKIASLKDLLNQATRSVEEYSRKMASIKSTGSGMISGTTIKEGGAGAALIPQIQGQIAALEQEKKSISSSQVLWQQRLDSLNNSSLATQRQVSDLARLNESFRTGQSELQKQAKAVDTTVDSIYNMMVALDKAATSQNKLNDAEKNKQQKKSDTAAERALEKYNNALNKTEVTIANRARKIEALANAERALIKTGRDYTNELTKIRTETERLNKANIDAANSVSKIKKNQSTLIDTSGQLQRKLALLFSVSQIEGYVMKLINIRGEFELQQRALQAILQNKDEADRLFGQITELAVRSPFRVKELVTYTKQLAAYRIETSKLYDTTKMLADVSAGLGVDMQRLILAFGQVKAANYLRGTELRQFSEAGINILGELATYFTELEGNMVSVGDVFERVSKRMVSFGDVEEIFKRITSAGGIFYNMQEIQAETLQGQISNLYDSMDIMFNEIGKANDGVLKNSVAIIKSLVESWEILANILKAASIGFVLYTAKVIVATAANKGFSVSQIEATIASGGLTKALAKTGLAFKSIAMFVKANPFIILTSAVIAGTFALIDHNKKVDEARSKYDILTDSLSRQKKEVSEIASKIKGQDEIIEKSAKSMSDFGKGTSEHTQAQEDNNKASRQRNLLLEELRTKYPQIYNGLVQQKDGTVDLTLAQEEYNKQLEQTNYLNFLAKQTETFLDSGLIENAQKMAEAQSVLNKETDKVSNAWTQLSNRLNVFLSTNENISEDVKKQFFDIANSSLSASQKMNQTYSLAQRLRVGDVVVLRKLISDYMVDTSDLAKANADFVKIQQTLSDQIKTVSEDAKASFNLTTEEGRAKAAETLRIFIESLGIQEQAVKDFITQRFEIVIGVKMAEMPIVSQYAGLQKSIKDFIEKNKLSIDIIKPDQSSTEYFNKLKADVKDSEEYIKRLKSATEELEPGIKNIEVIAREENKLAENRKVLSAFGESYQKDEKGISNIYKERVNLIKEMNSQYEKLIQNLNKEAAANQVRASYKDTFAELFKGTEMEGTIATMDFDVSGAISALEEILKTATGKARIEAQKALDGLRARVNLDVVVERTEEVKSEMEDLFSGYELSLELEKLNIPPELAKQLFNVDVFNLDELQKKAAPYLAELRAQGGDQIKVADDIEKKISDMQYKANVDRLKNYSAYLRRSMSERVNIELDGLRKIEELNKTEGFTEGQRKVIKTQIEEETTKKVEKQTFEEFKNADLYVQMFEDLGTTSSSVLEMMKDKLMGMRESLKKLDPQQLKEIQSRLREIDEQLVERNPFKNLSVNLRNYIKNYKNLGALQEKAAKSEEEKNKQQEIVDSLTKQVELAKEKAAAIENNKETSLGEVFVAKANVSIIEDSLNKQVEILAKKKEISIEDAKQVLIEREKTKLVSAQINSVGSMGSEAVGSMQEMLGMLENFGVEFGEQITGVLSGLGQAFAGLEKIDLMKPMSIISGIVGVVSGIGNSIASVFGFGNQDKKKEKQIQRELSLIETLEKAYNKLEKAIDNAYSIDTLQSANKQAKRNLEDRIAATKRAIAAEEDKKKTDSDRIKEMSDEIDDYKEQLKELETGRLESLGGFGAEANYKSAAEEFANAWYDAYKETGAGLSGLEDTFDSFIDNIVKKQLLLRGTERLLEPLLKIIDNVVDDGIVDLEEMDKINNQWDEQTKPALDALYKAIAESMGVVGGESESELSGLQRGIQSITEPTAQALESLLNSMRFFVADSNTQIKNIYALFSNPDAPNPILSELKAQTMLVRSIYDLFNGMTAPHPTFGKRALLTVI